MYTDQQKGEFFRLLDKGGTVRAAARAVGVDEDAVEGADAGIEVLVPVSVADVDPFVGALILAGAAQHVRFGARHGVEKHRQQLAQQIRAGAGESVSKSWRRSKSWAVVIAWSCLE